MRREAITPQAGTRPRLPGSEGDLWLVGTTEPWRQEDPGIRARRGCGPRRKPFPLSPQLPPGATDPRPVSAWKSHLATSVKARRLEPAEKTLPSPTLRRTTRAVRPTPRAEGRGRATCCEQCEAEGISDVCLWACFHKIVARWNERSLEGGGGGEGGGKILQTHLSLKDSTHLCFSPNKTESNKKNSCPTDDLLMAKGSHTFPRLAPGPRDHLLSVSTSSPWRTRSSPEPAPPTSWGQNTLSLMEAPQGTSCFQTHRGPEVALQGHWPVLPGRLTSLVKMSLPVFECTASNFLGLNHSVVSRTK